MKYFTYSTHIHTESSLRNSKNQCKQGMLKKTDENKKKKYEKRYNYYRIRMRKKREAYIRTEVGFLKLYNTPMTEWCVQG